MGSILTTIKKLLGLEEEYTPFDQDIIVFINSVFLTLKQLGVGPEAGYQIKSSEDKWKDFLEPSPLLDTVKDYIYLKVKILFDPPSSSFVLDAYKSQISELEWRMNVEVDRYEGGETDVVIQK